MEYVSPVLDLFACALVQHPALRRAHAASRPFVRAGSDSDVFRLWTLSTGSDFSSACCYLAFPRRRMRSLVCFLGTARQCSRRSATVP